MDLKKKVGALGVATAVVFGAGIAGAAWTTNGDGTGTAKAGTDAGLDVDDAVQAAPLYPGGTVNIIVDVANPNTYNVAVSDFDANGAITADDEDCDVSTVTFTSNEAVSYVLGGTNDTAELVAGTLSMNVDTADNDCKLATFTVPVTANGSSTGTAPTA